VAIPVAVVVAVFEVVAQAAQQHNLHSQDNQAHMVTALQVVNQHSKQQVMAPHIMVEVAVVALEALVL
jgi:hypothetical protein